MAETITRQTIHIREVSNKFDRESLGSLFNNMVVAYLIDRDKIGHRLCMKGKQY